ncbi:MAG: hypothetical protein JXR94_05560 [Candidatus Hydrogenedentes bacterium]|nr:hypothetical protein [Candidatus Hydrogenedentota bacterium]
MGVPALPFVLFGAFFLLVIVLGILGYLGEKKRREAFQRIAQELGLRYTKRDASLAQRYKFLDKLRQGSNRYAFNILEGQFEGYPVHAFDFHYETYSTDSKGRRQTDHHYFSFFLLEQERVFPELRIYPENILSRFGQMLGFDDIDFESIEFSKAFVVRSRDKKFAYDVCHTRMMEYLLRHRDISIEIEERCVSVSCPARLKPEQIPGRLRQLVEIRNLFPEYLYRG